MSIAKIKTFTDFFLRKRLAESLVLSRFHTIVTWSIHFCQDTC